MRRHHQHHGYVLVMTLILLALSATVTGTLCLKSLQKVSDATQAQEELQIRWGTISCRKALLPRVEEILKAEEESTQEPAASVRARLLLGSKEFQLIFADEQAKLNLNALYEEKEAASTEQIVQSLIPFSTATQLTCHLAPLKLDADPADDEQDAQHFLSFGQIFISPAAQQLISVEGVESAPADLLTCWGDGKLNVLRASQEALVQRCDQWLTHAHVARVLQARTASPNIKLGALLDQLQLTHEQRQQIEQRLTDRSGCHSVWVIANGRRRSWHELSVEHVRVRPERKQEQQDEQPEAKIELYTFRW